jgi:hypothetical protein
VCRSLVLLVLFASSAHAGVYSPDDPCPFTVTADGKAEALPHHLFVAQLVDRLAPRVPNTADPPGIPDWYPDPADESVAKSTYAARLGQRLAARWPKAQQLQGDDLAAHTAALLRYNAPLQAINLLDRGRVGRSYALKANRTHAFATGGQWADAVTNLPDEPEAPPTPTAGTTPEQFRWQRGIDHSAYLRWLNLRVVETDPKTKPPVSELVPDLLFEAADGKPIRYWESAEEAAKLPADAVAVVQQLLLWAPGDDRLLWTLAEVYFAKGRVRDAHSAYRMLASDEGRKFQGPRLLGQQVNRVAEQFAKLPKEDAPPPPPPPGGLFDVIDPLTFGITVGVFALVAVALLVLQIRSVVRRR